MSASRWRVLTAYLPGIASVVNSFQSPEVQLAVFQSLMKALDDKTDAEEAQLAAAKSKSRVPKKVERDEISGSNSELAFDIVEGESIHALMGKS